MDKKLDNDQMISTENVILKEEKTSNNMGIMEKPTLNINKKDQITKQDFLDELPTLEPILNYQQKLYEYDNLNLTPSELFCKNISNRYIIFILFARFSLCYTKYKRIGNFVSQISLYGFFLVIFFTADKKEEILNDKNKKETSLFVLYVLLSEIFSCILVHLPAFMFYIPEENFRKLYQLVKNDRGLQIMRQYDLLVNHRFWWNFLGVLIQWIYIIVGFHFSFTFCPVYYYQKKTFLLAYFVTIISDILFFEFLWECIIMIMFHLRKIGGVIVRLGEFFNRARNIKHLV